MRTVTRVFTFGIVGGVCGVDLWICHIAKVSVTQLVELLAESWRKTAQTHVTTTWPNEPRVSVASEAHGPRTRLSHAHICSSFLYNVFLHPELYNYFLFYTFSKLHLWWV